MTKFDIGVKWVKINPGHNLNNSGSTPIRCYILSFKVIGLLVLETIFKVFTIYGHGGHVDHVTQTI